jgi:cell division protein FtsZ
MEMVPKDYVDEVISALFDDAVDPRIAVVGVGGAGGNVVSTLYDRHVKGVETVAVNTDPAGLSKAEADTKILLPYVEGPDRAEAAAAAAEGSAALKEALGSDIVFVVAGLGGGAGTGAAPVVARAAKAQGAVTVAIGILPFEVEGRTASAQGGLERLRAEADSVLVVDNNSLEKFADRLGFNDALRVVNQVVLAVVQGVVDHLERSFLTTVAEEVENVAREIEEQQGHGVDVHVQAPESVQASWDLGPVAFDETGFIGLR